MKIRDLIERLQRVDPDFEVMILDGENGGVPRQINLGPIEHTISPEDIDATADCEEIELGAAVIVLGYGSY